MEPQVTSNGGVRTWQWVVTIIVIIALIIIGIFVFGSKQGANTGATASQSPMTTNPASNGNSIIMSDQFPGNVVYLSAVQADRPVWVEIHKDNNGQPGAIIGSALFQPGINPGKVTLTEPTIDGGTYYAMLHSDDGDGKFDPTKDLPLKDSNGNIIMRVFHATVSANNQIKG